MFSLVGNMKFITLDQEYIEELHNTCSEVYYEPSNYDDKPYFSILVNANGRTYAIPYLSEV
jgi:protein AbiQ